jgi:hypothetical protein
MITQAAHGTQADERETSSVGFVGRSANDQPRLDVLALSQEAAQALPAAIYTTNAEGRITF